MLTQLTTIKSRLGITDTTDDEVLTRIAEAVSSRFQMECDRVFARAEGILQEFRANELALALAVYPVEIIIGFELKSSESDGWQPQEDPVHQLRNGCVLELQSPLGGAWDQARVMYTGGYVMPGTTPDVGQVALPSDLEGACVEEVARWYQHRNRLGVQSASGEGSSIMLQPVSVITPLDLLPSTINTLSKYRRFSL